MKSTVAKKGVSSTFQSGVMNTPYKGKFFSLIPFFWESRFTAKSWVLKMEFFPEAKYLLLHTLTIHGVVQKYVPLEQVIPITNYDYWGASWLCFLKQHNCIDMDMIYANQLNKEMYLFDKTGTWHDEGVYHEGLNMENTFVETNWYDEFNV